MPNKKILSLILCSIAIYVLGNVLISALGVLIFPVRGHRLLSRYLPSVITMFALTIFLVKKVGWRRLVFNGGKASVKAVVFGIGIHIVYMVIAAKSYYHPLRNELSSLIGYEYVAALILVAVLGPIFEELLFRGFIFESARTKYGTGIAWCVSVVASLSAHFIFLPYNIEFMQVFDIFVGISIITISYQYGYLVASMAVHIFMNMYLFLIITSG